MKVWDLPTRLFHWLIVLVVGFSWYSAETGLMTWHYRSGMAALALLTFRLIWGFSGSSTARFMHFFRSPRAVVLHLRGGGSTSASAGHSPLGGYSVVAMLSTLIVQVVSGLFAVDVDGIESGPLSYLISFDLGRAAAELHEIAFTVIQMLVLLHVLAIVFYRLRGRRLLMRMITGRDAQLDAGTADVSGGGPVRAWGALLAASVVVWWIAAGAPM